MRSLSATPANSVGSAQIVDGQVLAPDLGAGSVGQAQLAAGAVTASKLAPDSVGGGSVANGSLQTVDIGSFTGGVQVDFAFDDATNRCQARRGGGGARPAGSPTSPTTSSWSRRRRVAGHVVVTGKPAPDNAIRDRGVLVRAGGARPPDSGLTIFRYVTFDAP